MDVCILNSTYRSFDIIKEIHIWISTDDYQDSNLQILLAYILLGHKNWKDASIKIYAIYAEGTIEKEKERYLILYKKEEFLYRHQT